MLCLLKFMHAVGEGGLRQLEILNVVLVETHVCCGRGGIMSVRNPECCAC